MASPIRHSCLAGLSPALVTCAATRPVLIYSQLDVVTPTKNLKCVKEIAVVAGLSQGVAAWWRGLLRRSGRLVATGGVVLQRRAVESSDACESAWRIIELCHTRFMSTTRFIVCMSLASFALATGCTTSKTDSEQLQQLLRRTSALEQQVHALAVTNAELQTQVRALQHQRQIPQMPPWSPPQPEQPPIPRVLPWSAPQNPPPRSLPPINQEPHLTPLDAK